MSGEVRGDVSFSDAKVLACCLLPVVSREALEGLLVAAVGSGVLSKAVELDSAEGLEEVPRGDLVGAEDACVDNPDAADQGEG